MLANGYTEHFAQQVFTQIKGFSGYGFPESHAASFALLAYASAWLKRHHPAAFTAALLNSQPMGFYAPAQLVRDAREHGVEVRPIDVNFSAWHCTLEPAGVHGFDRPPALRLGLCMVRGLRQACGDRVAAVRGAWCRRRGARHGLRQVRRVVRGDRWRRCGARRVQVRRPCVRWHAPMLSVPWALIAPRRCGRRSDCAKSACRCSSRPRPNPNRWKRAPRCRRCIPPSAPCTTITIPACRCADIRCASCASDWRVQVRGPAPRCRPRTSAPMAVACAWRAWCCCGRSRAPPRARCSSRWKTRAVP
ncbi:MAG: hypothetical protein EBR71_06945 [Planctomycetes bacterium]|nr:hypothetical protein [Planctomycetota bacterium]